MSSRMLWSFIWALLLLFLFWGLSSCVAATPMTKARTDGWSHFGIATHMRGDVVSLGALAGDETNVILEGVIDEVCPQMGCWMWVEEKGTKIFVRFQDKAFFVPKRAAGKKVVMHGMTMLQVVGVEELRHYAKDAGRSEEAIAAINEPEERITFFADSVFIEGDWKGAVDPDMICEDDMEARAGGW